jgi:3-deoxy-D-manno-octulosonic-acid transferase
MPASAEKKLNVSSARYSAFDPGRNDCRVLLVDNIGMLSSAYRYAAMAAVGGGFGKGIHNILEPACWGIPVLFGPNYDKFREAGDLISRGGAASFDSFETFYATVEKYLSDNTALSLAGAACASYIAENKGATDRVYEKIFQNN